ncbi:MAG: hypothetical protein APF80_06930 [Alphaproteobacteria bacterium BRH_c36]|nr:MAG: hypothetical protein APF80_06930 [Alphaproteobacteria bacterium BRH_c36]
MPGGTSHPALIAKVANPVTGEFLAIQRTALLEDGTGKAGIKKNKAALGSTAGGAVVFGDLYDGRAILEGEGIETVLSACQATGLPGIATLSDGTLGKPQLPKGKAVVILADLGSEKAARAGAQRRSAEGRKVQIALPPKTCGKDFNDTLRTLGVDAVTDAIDQAEDYQPSQRATKYSSTSLADVEAKPIRWLWPDRIARGKLGLLAGHPGRGKSQVSLYLAATVSNGGKWPDGTRGESARVILISCEDDLADTVVPRLKALDADLSRCHVLNGVPLESGEIRPFNLKADAAILEQMMDDFGNVALVVIDPISAYLDGIDSHKNSDVRGSLMPLQGVAERTGAAFLMVSHFNKGTPDSKAMSRVSGTGAFVATCRSAWIVENDPEDSDGKRRLLVPMKNNIGNDTTGFAFEIESVELTPEITTSRAKFLPGTVKVSADDLVRSEQGGSSKSSKEDEAAEFLRDYLASGARPQSEILMAAEAEGHKKRTLDRAKTRCAIKSDKIGDAWWWRLPDEDIATGDLFEPEGCQDRHIVSTGNCGNLAETHNKNPTIQGRQSLSFGNFGDLGAVDTLGDVDDLTADGEAP